MTSSPATVTVAEYLATRLHQLGADHLFGVPGDFNLTLLDTVAETGLLEWVGSPNELNAGYAADAYARSRGIGAVVTTYGVGELSAINAVAGAYAENAPVVEITGAPSTAQAAAGALLHHTLADGDFGHFSRAYAEVTVAAETLRADTAAEQIDRVLTAVVTALRPGYLSVPVDVATAPVDAAPLAVPLGRPAADPATVEAFRAAARELLRASSDAVVVAGHLVARRGLEADLRALAEAARLPVAGLLSARGVFDETHELFAGVYCGQLGHERTRELVDSTGTLITVGATMTDVVSGLFSNRQDPEHAIDLRLDAATVAGVEFGALPLDEALRALTDVVLELGPVPGRFTAGAVLPPAVPDPAPAGEDEPVTQAALWADLEAWLPAHHTLVTEIGTSFWGASGIRLPADTTVVSQPVWNSIGYTLPATLGTGLARSGRRPVLVIGDGSAQMTAQELGTLAARGIHPVVFLVNNGGYTIERAIQSPRAPYNDIVVWDWTRLPAALAPGSDVLTLSAATRPELRDCLDRAQAVVDRMVFVEVRTSADDVPELLASLAEASRRQVPAPATA